MSAALNILLIGGTGFLGRHICMAMDRHGVDGATLSRTPDTEFLSRFAPGVEALRSKWILDTSRLEDIDRAFERATHVIYLAQRSLAKSRDSDDMCVVSADLSMLSLVLERIGASPDPARLIYLSSGGQIYGRRSGAPALEHEPRMPTTRYGLSKLLSEEFIDFQVRNNNLRATVLRLANPVGRWQLQTSHGFVSAAVDRAVRGKSLTLFGFGNNERDYFDANDFAEFVLQTTIGGSWVNGTYNIGSGVGLTELEVLALVEEVTARRIKVVQEAARPFDLPYGVVDPAHARNTLKWNPTTTLAETIADVHAAASVSLSKYA